MQPQPATGDLGRMSRVDLRQIWEEEAADFTPWLSRPANLALLGEAIGIELELQGIEQEVGPFRADLVCRDTATGHWVLVENQLERTDHNHLGQLLTYAASLEAATIVWIAARFTQEHRAALDWLNEITAEGFNFFGLEIELWRIGESPVAPKFNVVCQPNDWSRTVQRTAGGEMSARRQKQLAFWTAFRDYMEEQHSPVRCQRPNAQNCMYHHIGHGKFCLVSVITTWDARNNRPSKEVRVELQLSGPDAKRAYAELESQKAAIEREVGRSLTWYNPPTAQQCAILAREDGDYTDEKQWPMLHEWLRTMLEKFSKAFPPRVSRPKQG